MNISEAIKTLDGVIPSSDNKMVDFEKVGFEHFFIAIAWEAVKTEIERLKKEVDYWEFETKVARKFIDKVCKETTKEIIDMLIPNCEVCDENWHKGCLCLRATIAEKIAKRYGVEVENDG